MGAARPLPDRGRRTGPGRRPGQRRVPRSDRDPDARRGHPVAAGRDGDVRAIGQTHRNRRRGRVPGLRSRIVHHRLRTRRRWWAMPADRLRTGYAAADYLGQLHVTGEQDARLGELWRDGAQEYLGMAVPEFPNFFMLYGPNTNVGSHSVIFMLEAQARYSVRALQHMRRKGDSYIAVRPSAPADFVAKIDRWMVGTVWLTRCSNYFRAANGRVVTQWPRSARSFWGMTRRFRAADFVLGAPSGPEAGTDGQVSALGGRVRCRGWTAPIASIPRCVRSRPHELISRCRPSGSCVSRSTT